MDYTQYYIFIVYNFANYLKCYIAGRSIVVPAHFIHHSTVVTPGCCIRKSHLVGRLQSIRLCVSSEMTISILKELILILILIQRFILPALLNCPGMHYIVTKTRAKNSTFLAVF
jgi:hypothetical protein